ncbi:sigma-70 family RNA polymerase sigma factor [Proteiniborus sp. MB09-C3]|uniref:RNA polymerase sigma factor n=1 Tax=Proteiniborus sp. MB09-C3 TaxID=3050072 RepID=UPI002557965D|nr:sigma-70 family RNA polymerase sigma factor [Proteiniborus sp. MB09-C3]WIV12688.1 sigma-70 family RNA polymerase sigma factor [Proteiniborus sp. MB09-C3]
MDTELLVKRAKQGDKDALVQLIMDKKQDYYKLAFIYMKNKDDSLDAMSDMIVIVHEKIHQLKKPEAFYSWSKTILVNCCKKLLKEKSKLISLEIVEEQGCESELKIKEDQIIVEEHLSKLNERHQEVIRLRYFLGLDYQTISDILKIPLGTVKSRISIGLKNLKESLGGDNYERN